MRSRLRLEELSEGRVIDIAREGWLEAEALEAEMEEPAGAPLGACALPAPGLLSSRSIELQVEAEVIGDGERGSLIEIGDKVRRDGGFPGVWAHGRGDGLGLLVHPPGGRQAEEGDVPPIRGQRLEAEGGWEVSQGECRSLAGEGLVAKSSRPWDLEPEASALGYGRAAGAEVGGEGAGALVGAGVGHEDRPDRAVLGS